MIENLTKLTDLLIDYRLVLGEEDSQNKQMTCIANLLDFYKNRVYKKELYVKYIYRLYDLHKLAENYTGQLAKLNKRLLNLKLKKNRKLNRKFHLQKSRSPCSCTPTCLAGPSTRSKSSSS